MTESEDRELARIFDRREAELIAHHPEVRLNEKMEVQIRRRDRALWILAFALAICLVFLEAQIRRRDRALWILAFALAICLVFLAAQNV